MNTTSPIARCAAVLAAATLVCVTLPVAAAQPAGNATNSIPLIVIDKVPLNDVIRNLARQADVNTILDPALTAGRGARALVSVRWQNLSANEALGRVLQEQGLWADENPATSVTRITFTNQGPRRVDGSLLGGDTNQVAPATAMIVMDTVPLGDAIRNLARQARVEVVIDPQVPGASGEAGTGQAPPVEVTIRWVKMTPRQAIVALCENYDLILVKDPASNAVRVKPRAGE